MGSGSGWAALAGQWMSVPVALVLLAGLVIAVRRQPRHPRVSLLAAGALVAGLAQFALGIGLQVWLAEGAGGNYGGIGPLIMMFSLVRMLLEVLIWILVLLAIFSDRPPAPTSES